MLLQLYLEAPMKLAKGKFMNCKLWFDTDHSKALSQRLAGFLRC